MNWAGAGIGGTAWESCLRELEHVARRVRLFRLSAREPEAPLPDVELSEWEQRAALEREATRRRWKGGAA